MMAKDCLARVGPYQVGDRQPLLIIAGPCVIEDESTTREIAARLVGLTQHRPLKLVFKASFDKANRTSVSSFRGPGLQEGLSILAKVRDEFEIPVTTDIHNPAQATAAAEVCDVLQIPAFLCRQTDLVLAAGQTGKCVNVKKGQFMAPADMVHIVSKLRSVGCRDMLLCERGTFFGYGRLVNDMRSLPQMRELGVPVIFDATHSVQEPGGLGGATGGNRAMVPILARAAVAVGIDGLFIETHPEPDRSPSDGANMVPLDQLDEMFDEILRIRHALETP